VYRKLKPGLSDGDPLNASGRKRLYGLVRVGLQPFRSAEAGLEGDDQAIARQSQPKPEQIRGSMTLVTIRVSLDGRVQRDAMKGCKDHFRFEIDTLKPIDQPTVSWGCSCLSPFEEISDLNDV
jgi:hypothetical protein